MSIVVLLSPSVFMEISRANGAVADQFTLFTLGISNFLPFFMPIFAALLYAPVVMQEVGTGGAWGPIMARRGRSPYVVRHAVRAACAGFIVFAGSVALVAVLSYGIHPHLIPVDFFNPFGDDLEPVAERLTFSQLYAVSPVLYFAFQSIWVGIGGAALSTLAAVGRCSLRIDLLHSSGFLSSCFSPSLSRGLFGWTTSALYDHSFQLVSPNKIPSSPWS